MRILPIFVSAFPLISASLLFFMDADLLRHFDYSQEAPIDLRVSSVEQRGDIAIHDISFPRAGAFLRTWSFPKAVALSRPSSGGTGIWKLPPCAIAKSFLRKPWRSPMQA